MNLNFGYIAIILVIILVSVILHELSHGAVAYLLGDNTAKDAGRLTLNPLKHIDPYMSILVPVVLYILKAPVFGGAKPVPINTRNLKWGVWGMALVAIAGPLTNFLLAFISFLIGHFTGWLYGSGGELLAFISSEFVLVNLGFMLFNLIPVPPLRMIIHPRAALHIRLLIGFSVSALVALDGLHGKVIKVVRHSHQSACSGPESRLCRKVRDFPQSRFLLRPSFFFLFR